MSHVGFLYCKLLFIILGANVKTDTLQSSAAQTESLNKKLGGGDMKLKRCCCYCWCTSCSICQFARALRKAREQNLIQDGAPLRKGAPADL